MGSFADVLRWLERLKSEAVVEDYAIIGAVAASIWDEATSTQDLDVAVLMARGAQSPLDPLRPVLTWLQREGYAFDGEHVVVAGVPVQVLPSWHPLIDEAIRSAVEVPYDTTDGGTPVSLRLVSPTYLVASWRLPGADSPIRAERAARLQSAGAVDEALLTTLVARYGL